MQHNKSSNTIATGLAMFSMFFGAGNSVFPLALGQIAQTQNFFAILGLLISAVGVPFTGLIAMILFQGNYVKFFDRMGHKVGFLISAVIMGLIGPFGALPRTITLSYSTMKIYIPGLSLLIFSGVSCVIIFFLTFRKSKVVEILGYFLTPVLLLSLVILIIKGIFTTPNVATETFHQPLAMFWKGLLEGYQTMDLLGAFFFSTVILGYLDLDTSGSKDSPEHKRQLVRRALEASAIGAALLSLTYIGFSYVTAIHSAELIGVPNDELPGRLANIILGTYGGFVACVAVALACLTTAIALATVFAEFGKNELSAGKISYDVWLIMTLLVSFFISTLHFGGIARFLLPILQVCYPALIVLSILNIFYKLYNFRPIKIPVAIAFLVGLFGYLLL